MKAQTHKYPKGTHYVVVMVFLFGVLYSGLSYLRYQSFFSYEWEDEAAYQQMLYHTAQGRTFYQTVSREFSRDGMFHAHFEPILLLFSLGYVLRDEILTFFVMKCFVFGAGAIPVFLLCSRKNGSPVLALFCAAAYLFYAPLNYLNLAAFKPIIFSVPLMVFTHYFFEAGRFKSFLFCLLLVFSCNELLCFTGVTYGIFAFFRKKRPVWAVTPVILGVGYYILAFHWILPRVNHPGFNNLTFATGSPENIIEFIAYTLTHPMEIYREMHLGKKLIYLWHLFHPFVFIPLLSPGILLLGAPYFIQILVTPEIIDNQTAHWLAPVLPFVILAFCNTMMRLYRQTVNSGYSLRNLRVGLAVLLLLPSAGLIRAQFGRNVIGMIDTDYIVDRRFMDARNIYDYRFYTQDEGDKIAWAMINAIPDNAPVAASGDLLVPLSLREYLIEYPVSQNYMYEDVDYILVHNQIMFHGAGHYEWFDADNSKNQRLVQEDLERLQSGNSWTLKRREGDFYLLQRVHPPSPETTGMPVEEGERSSTNFP